MNSFVYVCGGSNANNKSNVVERYCPATDEWKIMSSMHVSREDLAVVAFQGSIYALGGCDEVSVLDSVRKSVIFFIFHKKIVLSKALLFFFRLKGITLGSISGCV